MDKSYQFFLFRRQLDTEDEPSNFVPDAEKDQQNLYDVITNVNMVIRTWEVDRGAKIPRGNYDISKILQLIENQFHMVFTNKTINLSMDHYQYRVKIDPNVNFAIACYAERSILKLLRFGSQSTIIETPKKRAVEYMVFNANIYVQAKLPPSIQRISNMYVYLDIFELSPVGNSQVPIMGFLSIKSDFQENNHLVFNPPLYVRVREKNIRTITMKITTETGEEFPIHDDVVTCRLTFAGDHFWFRPI